MQNNINTTFATFYLINICVAWIQGGFWYIVLNTFFPVAIPMMIAQKIINLQ